MASQKKKLESFHFLHLEYEGSIVNLDHDHHSLWCLFRASLVAQMVRNLPVMQETWVQSLDREDPLEKGITAHSSLLAWRIPWTEEPGGLQF